MFKQISDAINPFNTVNRYVTDYVTAASDRFHHIASSIRHLIGHIHHQKPRFRASLKIAHNSVYMHLRMLQSWDMQDYAIYAKMHS